MNNEFISFFKTALTLICSFFGVLIGEIDGIFFVLLTLIVIDYLTGLLASIFTRSVNSLKGFKGIAKKVFILFFVMIANVIDVYIMGDLGIVRSVVISFYIANEGISILENAGKLGVSYPQRLKNLFEQLKEVKRDGDKF